MKRVYQVGLTLAIFLSLGGCGGSSTTIVDTGDNNGSSASKPALKVAANHSELEDYIRELMLDIYGNIRPEVYPVAYTDSIASDASGGAASNSYSTTNVQESGVDEADRIKTDGTYLYTTAVEKPALRIFKTDRASNTLIREIAPSGNNGNAFSGLYLNGQKLAVLGGSPQFYGIWDNWFVPSYWMKRSSDVFLFDTANPENPQQTAQLSVDGELISSRRIGSTLYLATRHTPTLTGLVEYPLTQAEVNTNISLINNATLADFLPDYQLDSGASGEIFTAGDCFLTEYSGKQNHQASIISLLAVDMDAAEPVPHGKCFAGDTETLYASTEAVYLATTQYNYDHVADDADATVTNYDTRITTDLHKFSLANGDIDYRGSGRVSGHLGWQQDLKPFRLSEYNGVLRLITYTGSWNDRTTSPASLYTLQENSADQSLDILAKLPNSTHPEPLGKTGEQIYATRFLGDKGYLVTFRTTDPLYILDLSNPADPFLVSELKIDGYSDYLHPVGQNYLLGVGKDAIAVEGGDENRGAWYQGVKLSLIDITDPANPYEKEKLIIGKRGTETAVSQTHHALTTLNRNGVLQLALPISVHDTLGSSGGVGVVPLDGPVSVDVAKAGTTGSLPPSTYYDWTKDGLYRLNIDPVAGTLQVLPEIIGSSRDTSTRTYSYGWANDRSVMIGDSVHYLYGDKVISQAW